ncbi:hypothetical protein N431DRAFT_24725 [Stipitochalara longipes BDJ]|nr:hypothetical protein N431DRAFT_24725 [Stipitochalara longipes BDJ]
MSGLEVVGSVASVVHLAQVVYEISKSLYEIGNALATTPSDILDLAHDLELFSEEVHLHTTVVITANHRYSDQVNRLTAKTIGRCATICKKIDRILKKLRTGGIYAKIRWLYKEKEIKKLLERLRDLKLSLLGTLSHLRSLEADHMVDALGVARSSLLEGTENEEISKETMADIEETRRKLMTLPMSVDRPCSVIYKVQQSARSCVSTKSTWSNGRYPYSQEPRYESSSLAASSAQLGSIVPLSSDASKLGSGGVLDAENQIEIPFTDSDIRPANQLPLDFAPTVDPDSYRDDALKAIPGVKIPHNRHSDDSPRARLDQLWWKAFLKMEMENPMHYGALLAACHRFVSEEPPFDDEGMARAEVEDLQNEIRHGRMQSHLFRIFASNSGRASLEQLIEILNIVRSTVGFHIGAFAWMCLCAAMKSHLNTKTDGDITHQEAKFSAFVDVATLIARYTVMENMYQNWPGMSLEPKYEESLMSLCIQVLNFLGRLLCREDELDTVVWTVAEEMAKINKADAICREFKVTILQDQSSHALDDVLEEEPDSDGTLEELSSTKRRAEDSSADDTDSDSTEVGYNQKEVAVEGGMSSKRAKV